MTETNQTIPEHPVSDRLLTCVDCGHDFVWEIGEILFYQSKGLAVPKRCLPCRKIRRATINKVDVEVDGDLLHGNR